MNFTSLLEFAVDLRNRDVTTEVALRRDLRLNLLWEIMEQLGEHYLNSKADGRNLRRLNWETANMLAKFKQEERDLGMPSDLTVIYDSTNTAALILGPNTKEWATGKDEHYQQKTKS